MKSRIFLCSLLFIFVVAGAVAGADNADSNQNKNVDGPWVRKVVFGLFLHGAGPISDKRRENGVDPNWELQFFPPDWRIWRFIGSPFTVVGITPNFNGQTSQLYGVINYEFNLSNRFTDPLTFNLTKILFFSGVLGPVVHNGPLKKSETSCENGDCGYGYRVLPRFSVEVGTHFPKNQGISVYLDHMSHKGIGNAQNEGLDHVGIRYHFIFNNNP
jgi:lipid A 3-O-deacylase